MIVCRYVERNALRASLVERAEDWPWSSLARRRRKGVESPWLVDVRDWPVSPPRNWTAFVNRSETEAELDAVRRSVARGAPYGEVSWPRRTVARLNLESSLRPPWRPKRGEHGKQK